MNNLVKIAGLLFMNVVVWAAVLALVFFSAPPSKPTELSSAPNIKVARAVAGKEVKIVKVTATAQPQRTATAKPTSMPSPTPTKPMPVSMAISSIGLEAPVEQVKSNCSAAGLWGYQEKGTTWCTLDKPAVGFMSNGYGSHDGFNGHSISEGFTKDKPGEFGDVFRFLPKVKGGDEMIITFADGTKRKYVAKKPIIGLPAEVFSTVPEESDAVYLITCACLAGKDPKVAPPKCWVCTGTQNGKRCSGGEWQIKFRLVIWFVPVPE